jgi:hypothetical protein
VNIFKSKVFQFISNFILPPGENPIAVNNNNNNNNNNVSFIQSLKISEVIVRVLKITCNPFN